MATLAVYVSEVFYYENDVTVTVWQDRLYENTTYIKVVQDHEIILNISLDESMYILEDIPEIVNSYLSDLEISEEFKYSVKIFEYTLHPAILTKKMIFEVTGEEGICYIRYNVNDSLFSRCISLTQDFKELTKIRYALDTLFYNLIAPEYTKK